MLHKDHCKPIREGFEFLDLVCLILEILRYVWFFPQSGILAILRSCTKSLICFTLQLRSLPVCPRQLGACPLFLGVTRRARTSCIPMATVSSSGTSMWVKSWNERLKLCELKNWKWKGHVSWQPLLGLLSWRWGTSRWNPQVPHLEMS